MLLISNLRHIYYVDIRYQIQKSMMSFAALRKCIAKKLQHYMIFKHYCIHHHHHHHVACPEADVAVPTSLLHACRFCAG